MPRSLAGSSLSRYASTDYESQPDPAFEGVNTDEMHATEIVIETQKLDDEKLFIEKEMKLMEEYCEKMEIPDVQVVPEDSTRLTRKKKKLNQEKKPEKLSIDQKNAVVTKLLDIIAKTKVTITNQHQKNMEDVSDELEQLMERIKEIQRIRLEFERDIGKIASTKGSGDKFLRFHSNFVNQVDANVGKLKLKKQAMKDQLKRVNLSLKQKEETGDTLLEVDFQQLRIENQQFLERIEKKNQELLFAKLKAGKCHAILAKQQNGLHEAALKHDDLQKKINDTLEMNKFNDIQYHFVRSELDDARVQKDDKQNLMRSYHVPTIMDYVKQNSKTEKARHDLKEWSRKLQIQEQENQMLRSKFSRL